MAEEAEEWVLFMGLELELGWMGLETTRKNRGEKGETPSWLDKNTEILILTFGYFDDGPWVAIVAF